MLPFWFVWCSYCVQKRYNVEHPRPLPPLSAAVEARAPESASVGPSPQQLPPLHVSPPRLPDNASVSERKQGGQGQRSTSTDVGPPHRGDGSEIGVGTTPPRAPADAGRHEEAQQHPRRRRRWRQEYSSMHPAQESAEFADSPRRGRHGAARNQASQGLPDGTRSVLYVSNAAETDKIKRASSINSTSSTGSTGSVNTSINSTSTRSSFEYS